MLLFCAISSLCACVVLLGRRRGESDVHTSPPVFLELEFPAALALASTNRADGDERNNLPQESKAQRLFF